MTSHDPLEEVRAERGYTLSYHEIYGRLEPELLQAYAGLYRESNLSPRFLTEAQREIVWIALLSSVHEEVGSIHLDRALDAGVPRIEIQAAIRLAACAAAWPTLSFAHQNWQSYLEDDAAPEDDYQSLVASQCPPIQEELGELALMVVHAALGQETPFLLHLTRSYQHFSEQEVGEAVSYILLPTGANQLLWATDRWLDAVNAGLLPGDGVIKPGYETRRS